MPNKKETVPEVQVQEQQRVKPLSNTSFIEKVSSDISTCLPNCDIPSKE